MALPQFQLISNGVNAWVFDAGILRSSNNLSDILSPSIARTNLGLTGIATAFPAGGLTIQSGNLVPVDYVKLVVSNKGDAVNGVIDSNRVETRIGGAFTVIGASWECSPVAISTSGSSLAMPYIRRSGVKTSLLSANASLGVGVSFTDATSTLTGTLTGAVNDTLGVDLVQVGTDSSGHIFTLAIRYS